MCTKYFADGDVHKYFNPYDSPYDSYINYMNVLNNLRKRCMASVAESTAKSTA
jgi:alpha-amylase